MNKQQVSKLYDKLPTCRPTKRVMNFLTMCCVDLVHPRRQSVNNGCKIPPKLVKQMKFSNIFWKINWDCSLFDPVSSIIIRQRSPIETTLSKTCRIPLFFCFYIQTEIREYSTLAWQTGGFRVWTIQNRIVFSGPVSQLEPFTAKLPHL